MAKKNLTTAAAEATKGFFSDMDDMEEVIEQPKEAPKKESPKKSTLKAEQGENGANTKPQTAKKVFTVKATEEDIESWRRYSKASNETLSDICTAAMNEYIKKHKLTEAQQAVYEALSNI